MKKVAFIIEAFSNRLAGPKNSVTLLAKHISNSKHIQCDVFSVLSETSFEANSIVVRPVREFQYANFDLCVFSGLYNLKYIPIARGLHKAGIPYLVSPRGSLTLSSLKVSPLKKIAFLVVYGVRLIRDSEGIHFLTQEERANSLKFGAKCFLSSNGVSSIHLVQKTVLYSERRNVLLFIGRFDIHHKGIDLLMGAMSECASLFRKANWSLEMYGDDYRGKGLFLIQQMVEKYGISDIVRIGKEVGLEEKFRLLSSSKCFIHTSRFEGQPQAVLEAIAQGVPVLVTPGTNMSEAVSRFNLGWAAGSGMDSIETALKNLVLAGEEPWQAKSESCIEYAQSNFNWREIAKDFEKDVVGQIL